MSPADGTGEARLGAGAGHPNRGAGALVALTALVLARTTVSFQFQSITLYLPALRERFPVELHDFGLLLGVYMAPGVPVALALPGLVRKIGQRGTLYLALAFMVAGQVGVLLAPSVGTAVAARLLAGVGGCIAYICTVSMVAGLRGAGGLAPRMGLIASSWPLGNALALLVLGALAVSRGSEPAGVLPLAAVLAAAALFLAGTGFGRGGAATGAVSRGAGLGAWWAGLARTWTVGACFAFYNTGFVLLTSFSPHLLTSQGYSAAAAATVASLPMWVFVLSVPLGGLLAGRSGKRTAWLVSVGLVGAGLCMVASQFAVWKEPWYVLAGVLGGLPAGPVLARAGERHGQAGGEDSAYAVVFLVFFVSLMLFPPLVASVAQRLGRMDAVVWICAMMQLVALVLFCLPRAERSPSRT